MLLVCILLSPLGSTCTAMYCTGGQVGTPRLHAWKLVAAQKGLKEEHPSRHTGNNRYGNHAWVLTLYLFQTLESKPLWLSSIKSLYNIKFIELYLIDKSKVLVQCCRSAVCFFILYYDTLVSGPWSKSQATMKAYHDKPIL